MAGTLMDALNQQMSTPAASPTGGGEATQQQVQLQQAKSGRSVDDAGTPRASSLGEAAAAGAARSQAAATAQQGAGVAAKLGGEADKQESEFAAQSQQISDARMQQKQKFADSAASIAQELSQGQGQVDVERDKQKAEQLGFLTRLGDDKYTTQLQEAGAQARLDDQNTFDEKLQGTVLGDNEALLQQRLGDENLLNISKTDLQDVLNKMDLNFAIQVAGINITTDNNKALAQGVGNATSAAAQGVADSKKNKSIDSTGGDTGGDGN